MERVQLGIWQLWWECPHCLHDNVVEIDEGEEPPIELSVRCQICKREYIAEFDPLLPRGIHDTAAFRPSPAAPDSAFPCPECGGTIGHRVNCPDGIAFSRPVG